MDEHAKMPGVLDFADLQEQQEGKGKQMKIHLLPLGQGITADELGQRIQAGWMYVGQMRIAQKGIIGPTKPMTSWGLVPAEVWVLSEPMMPVGVFAGTIVQMVGEGKHDVARLDALSKAVLG